MAAKSKKSLPDKVRFPELFNPNRSIDRSKCRREVPMKVLNLGLFRTGTTSIRTALEELGFRECYHMVNLLHDPDDAQWWMRALRAKRGEGTFTKEDWDHLLGSSQAVCDIPPILFAHELIATYPEAKVILSNRDVDAWYESCKETVWVALAERNNDVLRKALMALDWWHSGQVIAAATEHMATWLGPGGPTEENAKARFKEHYDSVRKSVPPENLLEYRVQDGWGPLCEFLEVPKPDKPYPRVNETESFNDRRAVIAKLALRRVAKKSLPYAATVAMIGILCLGA